MAIRFPGMDGCSKFLYGYAGYVQMGEKSSEAMSIKLLLQHGHLLISQANSPDIRKAVLSKGVVVWLFGFFGPFLHLWEKALAR